MNENLDPSNEHFTPEEQDIDKALRPLSFDDFAGQECVAPRIPPDPGQPTQKQLDDHRVDHLPFRSWCPGNVAGRATGEQHVVRKDPKQIATFSMDHLYCTKSRGTRKEGLEEGEDVEMKVLVAKDAKSNTISAR